MREIISPLKDEKDFLASDDNSALLNNYQ